MTKQTTLELGRMYEIRDRIIKVLPKDYAGQWLAMGMLIQLAVEIGINLAGKEECLQMISDMVNIESAQ